MILSITKNNRINAFTCSLQYITCQCIISLPIQMFKFFSKMQARASIWRQIDVCSILFGSVRKAVMFENTHIHRGTKRNTNGKNASPSNRTCTCTQSSRHSGMSLIASRCSKYFQNSLAIVALETNNALLLRERERNSQYTV